MQTINNVHLQFASFFKSENLKPLAFLLSKKVNEGHVCLRLSDINADNDFVSIFGTVEDHSIKAELENEVLIGKKNEIKPFILHQNNLYLQRYFYYETSILDRLKKFAENEQLHFQTNREKLFAAKDVFTEMFTLEYEHAAKTNWQIVAVVNAVLNDFSIITGGPGTGKTTTVAKILAMLFHIHPHMNIALAAPTGKAAARMMDALKLNLNQFPQLENKLNELKPLTLHRLLNISSSTYQPKYNKENVLPYDLIIIDECSMIDVALFAKLMNAIGNHTKLVMLGDKNQLASVEAGSLFGDLCKSVQGSNLFETNRAMVINEFMKNTGTAIPDTHITTQTINPLFQHIVELQHSFRFSNNEGIGKLSKAILNNSKVDIENCISNTNENQVVIDEHFSPEIFEQFVLGYKDFIEEPDLSKAIIKFNAVRILCAVNEGIHGVNSLNKKVESLLRKHRLLHVNTENYENRPIIITRNRYDLDLFNGDIGILRADESGTTYAWFLNNNQELIKVMPNYITSCETVFAMTIHKSQGSEFDKVFIILPELTNTTLMTKELLYTAVTRAKKSVIIQGKAEVIYAISDKSVQRISGIVERLNKAE